MTVKASNTCVLLRSVISTASWLEFTARCASDVSTMRIAAAAVSLRLCYWGRKKNKHRGRICSAGAVNTGTSLWVQAGSHGCSEQTNDSLVFTGDLTASSIWMCLLGNKQKATSSSGSYLIMARRRELTLSLRDEHPEVVGHLLSFPMATSPQIH